MAYSRKRAWLRDEVILALDLFVREGSGAFSTRKDLSDLLRSLPIEPELAASPTFRSEAAVARKLANFLSISSDLREGLPHFSTSDVDVWNEFHDSPDDLRRVALAIRSNIGALPPSERSAADDEEAFVREGALLTRVHRTRERNKGLVARKKQAALAREHCLRCEACGLDFEAIYGKRGHGFIECHHLAPLATLRPGQPTRLRDLALVCANCHRMIHRRAPWLSMGELKSLIASARANATPPR